MIGGFIQGISQSVNDTLADLGLPALTDGGVMLGKRYLDDGLPPPRVIFVRRAFMHGPPDSTAPPRAERTKGIQRALWTRTSTFDVHVIADATAGDAAVEYDLAEAIADSVILATHKVACGCYQLGDGRDVDEEDGPMQVPATTHHMVFALAVDIPVTDSPVAPSLAYVPTGTAANPTVTFQPAEGGDPEAP